MTVEILLKHFEQLAEGPSPIAKLRRLILQLAVRGKLVPQDASDEPASVLIEKLGAERRRLIRAGAIHESEQLPRTDHEQWPYSLPKYWVWVRILDVCYALSPGTHKVKTSDIRDSGAYPVVDQGQSRIAGYIDDPSRVIEIPGPVVVFGDHTRAVKYVDFNFVAGADGTKILSPLGISEWYFYWVLRSYDLESRGYGRHFGVLTAQPFPLPSVAEQKRIVAKVDELMALCDDLEAKQLKKRAVRIMLNRACLRAVTQPSGAGPATAWHRVRDHLDDLYCVPETVAELRRTILQLAVMGRLVPQDPNDEPASELLKEIHAERRRRIAEGSIRKGEGLPSAGSQDIWYEIPRSWVWTHFGDVTFNRDGERVPVSREKREHRQGPYPYYGASGVIDSIDEYLFDKPLLLVGEDGANLVNRSTPIAFIAAGQYWVNNHAHVLDSLDLDMLRYLELFVNATDLTLYITGTAQPKMNQAKMNRIPVALPPAGEQKRIVARVDRLMAQCDELESRLQRTEANAETLLASVVRELVTAERGAAR